MGGSAARDGVYRGVVTYGKTGSEQNRRPASLRVFRCQTHCCTFSVV